jgi:hypothetical protein
MILDYIHHNTVFVCILQGLMVVGIDICIDGMQGTSVGVLVASLNKPMTQYFSAVSTCHTSEGLANELSTNLCSEYKTVVQPTVWKYEVKLV